MTFKYAQLIILAAVFMLQYFFEHLYPQKKEINDWKNERFNIAIGCLNVALVFFPAALLVKSVEWIDTYNLGVLQQLNAALWIQIVVAIFILDFWMYVWHQLNHTVTFLWRFHLFHHLDKKMNSTTALRFHIAELLLSYPGKILVCLLFGISYAPLLIYELLFFIAVVIHHSNIFITERCDAVYRTLFASPRMHRIHHSIKKEERNTNYGALFSFWDLFFRTRKNNTEEEVVFGIEME
jgi:sterol desaturase/sphingolipid hydroxylase (fatty acid hydroxylase superfamily)